MSKLNEYYALKEQAEKISAQLSKLETDQELKKEFEFSEKLKALMGQYGKDASAVLTALGIEAGAKGTKKKSAKAATRPMKVYKNPKTGEEVHTRGGNHKVLNAWRQQYGKEKVDSWLQ